MMQVIQSHTFVTLGSGVVPDCHGGLGLIRPVHSPVFALPEGRVAVLSSE